MRIKKEQIKDILKISFPEYTGRKFSVEAAKQQYIDTIWGGGSRDYAIIVKQENDKWITVSAKDMKCGYVDIPADCLLVMNQIFQGHDMGIRIVYHPQSIFIQQLIGSTV